VHRGYDWDPFTWQVIQKINTVQMDQVYVPEANFVESFGVMRVRRSPGSIIDDVRNRQPLEQVSLHLGSCRRQHHRAMSGSNQGVVEGQQVLERVSEGHRDGLREALSTAAVYGGFDVSFRVPSLAGGRPGVPAEESPRRAKAGASMVSCLRSLQTGSE